MFEKNQSKSNDHKIVIKNIGNLKIKRYKKYICMYISSFIFRKLNFVYNYSFFFHMIH